MSQEITEIPLKHVVNRGYDVLQSIKAKATRENYKQSCIFIIIHSLGANCTLQALLTYYVMRVHLNSSVSCTLKTSLQKNNNKKNN